MRNINLADVVVVVCAMFAVEQTVLQPPQLLTSAPPMSTSQPSVVLLALQSP